MSPIYIISLVLTFVAAIVGMVWLVRLIGLACQFCSNSRVSFFNELTAEQQDTILDYFQTYEHRTPDTKAIFVCCDCNTVFDDFSGEKKSMEADYGRGGCRTWCKACHQMVYECNLDNDNIGCPDCNTPYKWDVYKDTGFRFLMPPPNTKLLSKCRDLFGSS